MIATAVVDEIKSELARQLGSRTEWDEPPGLFTVHWRGGRGLSLVSVPVPDVVWQTLGHPPTVVAAIAAAAPRMPRNPDGSHLLVMPGEGRLIGAAFRYEAYSISGGSDSPAAQEAVRRRTAGGSTPRFKDIPGRIEQRCMTAVDLDGGRYMASSDRIDETQSEAAEPVVHHFPFGDPKRDRLKGNVIDAVTRFLNAIKPVPPRPGTTFGRTTQ